VRPIDPPVVVGDPTRLRELTPRRSSFDLDRSLSDMLNECRATVVAGGPTVVRG